MGEENKEEELPALLNSIFRYYKGKGYSYGQWDAVFFTRYVDVNITNYVLYKHEKPKEIRIGEGSIHIPKVGEMNLYITKESEVLATSEQFRLRHDEFKSIFPELDDNKIGGIVEVVKEITNEKMGVITVKSQLYLIQER